MATAPYLSGWIGTALALAIVITLPRVTVSDELYRWEDDQGNVHYSDSLPASRAPDARDVYDRSGRRIDRIEASLSEEERALEQERAEQEREAEALAEKRRAEQADYDRMLRLTYSTEDQIERARDDRIENLRASADLARSRVERYREELETLREEAARIERASGEDPGPVHERISEIRSLIDAQQAVVDESEARATEVEHTFNDHLERFRELRAEGNDNG